METYSIVAICLAVVVVIASVAFVLYKSKRLGKKDDALQNTLQEKVSNLEEQLAEKEHINIKIQDECAALSVQREKLEKELNSFMESNVDDILKSKIAEINELKKQIKKLEEDIEDQDEDLDDYRRKLKNKGQENDKLEKKLREEQKQNKQTREELEKAQSELEDKRRDLELKMQSLLFVQEVLNAKPVSDGDVNKHYRNVDAVCDFVSGTLRDVIKRYNLEMREEYFYHGLTKWAATAKKSWINGKKAIAFVGEFSAGKTSIVNRILSQDDNNVPRLPVSTKATTAIPTYISGGVVDTAQYNFIAPDNTQKKISEETFRRVSKEVLDEVNGVSSLIQYFVMRYANENLNKLSVLDTPGFSSNDKEDAQRTIDVINECDALFWVFDVNSGTVNKSSISLIKSHLRKPLYIVINKVDTKSDGEVNKVENLIRKTLQDEGISIEGVIRFSSKAPLSNIMDPIFSVPYNSSQNDYLSGLRKYIDDLCSQAKSEVSNAMKERTKLINQGNDLKRKYENSIASMQEECERIAKIPRWEEHWFSKDRFEMNEEECQDMMNGLVNISEQYVDELKDIYNKRMDVDLDIQTAFDEHSNMKELWNELNSCREQLNKLLKPFNK